MNRLLIVLVAGLILSALSNLQAQETVRSDDSLDRIEETNEMSDNLIKVTANGKVIVFKLNSSDAAKELLEQLPLSIDVEDYSNNEKIFYPPKKLKTSNTPEANAQAGTLAYYAPWGDVVMFYKRFGSAAGLYELGQAVSGNEQIQELAGTIQIDKSTAP